MKYPLLIFVFLFSGIIARSQDVLYLKNPSFEDIPRKGKIGFNPIKGWEDCGQVFYPKESAPDVLPTTDKAWGVDINPFDGETFLALVSRKNKTFESVGQRLPAPMLAGACYTITLRLAFSEDFACIPGDHGRSGPEIKFSNPLKLKFWGGKTNCDKASLLGETQTISVHEWEFHEVTLSPSVNCTNIILEAAFATDSLRPYNGHILIDNLSPIIQKECD